MAVTRTQTRRTPALTAIAAIQESPEAGQGFAAQQSANLRGRWYAATGDISAGLRQNV